MADHGWSETRVAWTWRPSGSSWETGAIAPLDPRCTVAQMDSGDVSLNEYDKAEWFDVARILKPGLTEAEYNAMWERFIAFKAEYAKRLATQ